MPANIRIPSILLFLVCFCLTTGISAQQKKIRNAEGTCELTRHITLEEAEQKALHEAKLDALRKAGVPENVWSVLGMTASQDNQHLQEAYSEMSVLAVGGLVRLTDKPSYRRYFDPVDGKEYVSARIDAAVSTKNQTDPSYTIQVKDLQQVYREGEEISFGIRFYGTDSFLKIFWFTEDDGAILYPNDFDTDRKFAQQEYRFPLNPDLYSILATKEEDGKDIQQVNVFFVATKKNIPFIEEDVTFESIFQWIYSIPPAQRCVQVSNFLIR